jgi:hypothetical protein
MPRPSPIVASVFVGALLACQFGSGDTTTDNDNFRADVIDCEESLAYLRSCCPGFDPTRVACHYYDQKTTACGETTETSEGPAISQQESDCILARACDSLVQDHVCERAQAATPYTSNTTTNTGGGPSVPIAPTSSTHPPVCP